METMARRRDRSHPDRAGRTANYADIEARRLAETIEAGDCRCSRFSAPAERSAPVLGRSNPRTAESFTQFQYFSAIGCCCGRGAEPRPGVARSIPADLRALAGGQKISNDRACVGQSAMAGIFRHWHCQHAGGFWNAE